jgi:pimeloyl-ACP methyl ester carboxylesterase
MTALDASPDGVLPPWPGQLVSAGGVELYVRSTPPTSAAAPPALFVHGLGGSARNWTDLMGELRAEVAGEAVDLPGFGQSPPPRGDDYSITGHCAAVIRLLEHRARGPVHLFGNSLGGAVVTRVAALRPDLVRTLTLVSPALPHLRPRRTNAMLGLYGVPGFSRLIGSWLAARSPEQRAQAMFDYIYADPARLPAARLAEAVEEYQRRESLTHASDALLSSLRGLLLAFLDRSESSLWRQAAAVQVPTLLIYGQRDKLVDPITARKASTTFPDSRLVVLPDSGHVAMMEHPELVAKAFRAFLTSGHDQAGGN